MGWVAQKLGIASPAGNVAVRRSRMGVDPKLKLQEDVARLLSSEGTANG